MKITTFLWNKSFNFLARTKQVLNTQLNVRACSLSHNESEAQIISHWKCSGSPKTRRPFRRVIQVCVRDHRFLARTKHACVAQTIEINQWDSYTFTGNMTQKRPVCHMCIRRLLHFGHLFWSHSSVSSWSPFCGKHKTYMCGTHNLSELMSLLFNHNNTVHEAQIISL